MPLYVLWYIIFVFLLFIIGVYGLATKRNIIKMVISIEIMINAGHLSFVTFSTNASIGFIDPFAQGFVLLSMAIGAVVISLALLLSIHVYRNYNTLDILALRRLRR